MELIDAKTRTFESIVILWLDHIVDQGEHDSAKIKDHRDRLFNYPVRLWKNKCIDELKHSDLENFIQWRKTNGKKRDKDGKSVVPTASTIKRDIVPLRQVLKFAYNKEFITRPLTFDRIPVDVNPTPCFLEEEWLQIMKHLDDWSSKVKWNNKKHIRSRIYLKYYVLILGLTGIRPGVEAQAITWESLKLERVGGTSTWIIYVPKVKQAKDP